MYYTSGGNGRFFFTVSSQGEKMTCLTQIFPLPLAINSEGVKLG